jgi:pimeloyl-ACP methyl ester carboxylesterase
MDRRLWRQVSAGLAGWQRIVPDLPGFGLSDPLPPGSASIAAYADDLARLLDDRGVERIVLAGLSLGGYVAFEFWRRHRDRVRALVLVSTRAEPDPPEGRAKRDEMIAQIRADGVRILAESFAPRLLAPGTPADSPAAVNLRAMALDNPADGMVAAVAAMRDRNDSAGLLGSISVPTLVVAGGRDGVIPPDVSRAIATAVPGARFEVLANAGHAAPLEQPDETAALLSDFLKSLP